VGYEKNPLFKKVTFKKYNKKQIEIGDCKSRQIQ